MFLCCCSQCCILLNQKWSEWLWLTCVCVFLSHPSCTQLDAWWNMVMKMVRIHLMRPQLWDQVKWPSIMGTGVLYLLLLSTCLGQDTEGKVSLSLKPLFPLLIYLLFSHYLCLCLVFSLCLHLFFLLFYNSEPIQFLSAWLQCQNCAHDFRLNFKRRPLWRFLVHYWSMWYLLMIEDA